MPERNLGEIFSQAYDNCNPYWSTHTVARELAQYALESSELPDLFEMLEQDPQNGQKKFDSLVEQEFTFLIGEARNWLKDEQGRSI